MFKASVFFLKCTTNKLIFKFNQKISTYLALSLKPHGVLIGDGVVGEGVVTTGTGECVVDGAGSLKKHEL